jgi:hypothetical protein
MGYYGFALLLPIGFSPLEHHLRLRPAKYGIGVNKRAPGGGEGLHVR